jgi:hypothetical protein
MHPLTTNLFAKMSMHAKVQRRLDSIDVRFNRVIQRIEQEEIKHYDDDGRFAELEQMKRELLAIRFLEKEDRTLTGPSP